MIPPKTNSEILLYQSDDGQLKIQVRLENETVWLTQADMVELFQTTKQNISLHIKNIFEEGELDKNSVVKEYLTTASDGKNYRTKHYNLDVIISVGYRGKIASRDAISDMGNGAFAGVPDKRLHDERRFAQARGRLF